MIEKRLEDRGGTQQMFIQRGSAPMSNFLTLDIPFLTEKVPLSYIFYWQMVYAPLHVPSLELCTPEYCRTYTFFKLWISRQTRKFSRLFHLLALGSFQRPKTSEIPTLLNTWKKITPFRRSLPFIGITPGSSFWNFLMFPQNALTTAVLRSSKRLPKKSQLD